MNNLLTDIGRLKLINPVTVASGTFGIESSEYLDLNRLGAVITKTITKEPKDGNPPPRLFEVPNGLLNSIGLQNPGLDSFVHDVLPFYDNYKTPLLVSFSGSSISEFEEILSKLEEYPDIAGYEINVSCPNVEKQGIAFGTDDDVLFELIQKLRALTYKQLTVKLSPNVTDIVTIAQAAVDGGADCLALINSLYGMAIDWKTGKSRIAKGIAGYTGMGIKPVALSTVYRVAQKIKIPIIAMGGIYSWQDAIEFMYAGATAVAIGTAQFINPNLPVEIIEGLESFVQEKHISLEDLRGKVWGIE
jgi:dihydroorotate dehydrogenase (NAD+) catalytic subunit